MSETSTALGLRWWGGAAFKSIKARWRPHADRWRPHVEAIFLYIRTMEALLASREESSRAVQSPEETTADVANDPARESNPQTLPPRETWPPHLRPRDEATTVPATDDGPGDGYRWVNTGEALEADDELLRRGNGWGATLLAGTGCGQPNTYRRRITTAEAVPDDAGRRLVDGAPMTPAEMMHALTVAREEIARLTAERDEAATPVDAERRAYVEGMACAEDRDFANMLIYHVAVLRAEIARLTAERDSHRSRVGSLRSSVARLADLNASLTAQRDAALREVERHRMTEQEKMVLCSAPGTWTEMNWSRFLSAMRGYLERTEAK